MTNLQVGNALIDFTLPSTDGNTYNAYKYLEGATALVLVFTTNQCLYVRAWEGCVNALASEYAPRDVRMLAIDPVEQPRYPANSPDNMVGPVSQMAYVFPYLLDAGQEVARAYGATVTPEVYVFDAVGILRYHGAVDDNAENEQAVTVSYLQHALQQYLDGATVLLPEAEPVGCPIEWKE